MLRDYIHHGDILFSTVGSIGDVSLMDSNEKACIAQNIVAFRAKNDYDPKFLYSLFSTEHNQQLALRIVMGAVQPSIKVSQLINVEYLFLNNLKEQKKIGELFYSIDKLITLHQREQDSVSMCFFSKDPKEISLLDQHLYSLILELYANTFFLLYSYLNVLTF